MLKDLLGEDGDDAMHDIKKAFQKDKDRDKRIIDLVHISNRHFELKMHQRMVKCEARIRRSKMKTYRKFGFEWRSECKKVMKEKRTKSIRCT